MSMEPRTPKRPTRIALSDQHKTVRMVLICLLLAVGVTALAYGLYTLIRPDSGWQQVEASCDGINVSQDFVLQYEYSGTTSERRELTSLYSHALEDAYWIFTADQAPEHYGNLYTLNHKPNVPHEVHPALYEALELLEQFGSRQLYLGPVHREYHNLFLSESEVQAESFDPTLSGDAARYVKTLMAFITGSDSVYLELMEDNKVTLHVSPAYLQFAQEQEIDTFLDFHFMVNAFRTDFLADTLQAAGFTNGYLASFDGFTRNLHGSGESFSLNVYDFSDSTIYPAARMHYKGPMSLVSLRAFPMMQEDRYHYYAYSTGRIVTPYLSEHSGLYGQSLEMLISCSRTKSCARILLEILPIYTADSFRRDSLQNLNAIDSLWCDDGVIYRTNPGLSVTDLLTTEEISYRLEK